MNDPTYANPQTDERPSTPKERSLCVRLNLRNEAMLPHKVAQLLRSRNRTQLAAYFTEIGEPTSGAWVSRFCIRHGIPEHAAKALQVGQH